MSYPSKTIFLLSCLCLLNTQQGLSAQEAAPLTPTEQTGPHQDDETCQACDERDINQIGAGQPHYEFKSTALAFPDKGRRYELPFGAQPLGVTYKAGAGLWLHDFGPASHLYLKPQKDNVSIGLKVNF
jgi:hypothetical protein